MPSANLGDLKLGLPELGSASFSELASLRGTLGWPVECDLHSAHGRRTGNRPAGVSVAVA
ncbi:MAG: DUF2958 domain-containing protein [Geminicoccaceae bacterium]